MTVTRPASHKVAVAVAAAVVLLACVLWGTWRIFHVAPVPSPPPPQLTREGEFLRVRPGSALQKIVLSQPVPMLALPREIPLPAQVIAPPGNQINVFPPFTGQVLTLNVRPGQHVHKGDVLVTMVTSQAAQAVADARKAQAALTLAQQDYQRAKGVLAVGGNALKDLQSAKATLVEAEAEMTRAHDTLASMGLTNTSANNIEAESHTTPVTSPVSGIISDIHVGAGQNVTDQTTPMLTVTDLKDVWVSASAPQDMLNLFRPGMTLTANFNGHICSGPVVAQDPALNDETRRLNLFLACANPDHALHPGAFTTASLSVPERDVVMLPKTSLLMSNDQVTVFVEVGPNTYRRQPVSISYDEGDNVRVLGGVHQGEHVVVRGAILLNDY